LHAMNNINTTKTEPGVNRIQVTYMTPKFAQIVCAMNFQVTKITS